MDCCGFGGAETIAWALFPGEWDDFAKLLPPETPVGGRPFGWPEAVRKIVEGERSCSTPAACGVTVCVRSWARAALLCERAEPGVCGGGAVHFASLRRWLGGRPGYLARHCGPC